ncbi:MAG TPA: peptide MFS transporter [Thermoanaerobaculia bacterium]|nr:peptide MFS transporter [Thermoanaerobaculia bacterium]
MTTSSMAGPQWFGHPRGLSTLFFTEMWERFSYYGMRALLVLFLTDTARGGFGLETQTATAIYGLYTFGVYVMALPGGWVADRLIGTKRSVLYGGIVIALGHYCLAIQNQSTFFVGLALIVLGTGLLKPNVSAIVGDLYPEGGARRDAGFSVFYSGINVGAFLGQLVCPFLGEKYDWHLGFGAAAIGMTAGVIQYALGQRHLEGAGEHHRTASHEERASAFKQFVIGVGSFAVLVAVLIAGSSAGYVPLTLVQFATWTGYIVVALAVLYFAYVITFVCRDRIERGRIGVCAFLFVGAALFWAGFEQAGSSMTLFARDFTDRMLGTFEVPAGSVQNVNALLIILLAPVVGALWIKLGARNPSIPVKFALGLVLLGVGFLVLAWGANYVDPGKVGMQWLVVTYFFHTVGELCLSPVGLSSMTKLAPERLVGQMMGTWFMGAALGNLFAGLIGGYIESMPMPNLFGTVAAISVGAGLLFLVFSPLINRLAHGVR